MVVEVRIGQRQLGNAADTVPSLLQSPFYEKSY